MMSRYKETKIQFQQCRGRGIEIRPRLRHLPRLRDSRGRDKVSARSVNSATKR